MNKGNKSYSKHKGTLILLIVSTIVFALLITPGVWVSMMSVMLFDAPGSENNPYVLAFFYSIVSFPVLCVFSFSSWVFYAFKLYKTSIVVSLAPLLSIFAVIMQFFVSFELFNGSFGPQ